jgi:hypothetical protein
VTLLPPLVVSRDTCRGCGAAPLDPLLDLGPQHLVDFPAEPGGMTTPATPVVVVRCPRCTLVQLRDTVPADWRYTQYWYRSAVNETMVAELRDVVAQARQRTTITCSYSRYPFHHACRAPIKS